MTVDQHGGDCGREHMGIARIEPDVHVDPADRLVEPARLGEQRGRPVRDEAAMCVEHQARPEVGGAAGVGGLRGSMYR